jgi:3-methyl-2-oxobutanoate hydroxymethyltransferase
MAKKTVATFLEMKQKGEKITMLTAYDYSMAKVLDRAGVDSILVGDSLGMTMLGYENTLAVTIEDMIHHTKAVKRGTEEALVVCDMPFMSYHISAEDAVANAGRIIKETGAHAVKVEGGSVVEKQIRAIVNAQIPVMGHLGLTPQSVNAMGGFLVQGKSEEQAKLIIEEAKLLEKIGCFSIVLECIPEKLARIISEHVSIPTIGIGAGAGCDGQVLVIQDMLGLTSDFSPKFVKHYAELGVSIDEAVRTYCSEVKSGVFPALTHTFKISDAVLEKLY